MHIHHGAPAEWRATRLSSGRAACVVAIGNFDGVHRGHRALIGAALRRARDFGVETAVLTFEPHPRSVFQADAPPFRLTLEPLKARRIAELGVDRLFVARFEPALFKLSAEAFARDVLAEALGAVGVVTGADFRFGAGREGDAAALAELGRRFGFEASAIEPVGGPSGVFSSTAARQALREGRPEDAARVLGAWHAVEGVVEKGHQRGRRLGFPTANLGFGEALRPAFGVYATRATALDGPHAGVYDGVASIGQRPTFGAFVENFEVYLCDFEGDLYGAGLSVELRRFLRPELKFDTVDALVAQMRRDVAEARAALAEGASEAPPWAE